MNANDEWERLYVEKPAFGKRTSKQVMQGKCEVKLLQVLIQFAI